MLADEQEEKGRTSAQKKTINLREGKNRSKSYSARKKAAKVEEDEFGSLGLSGAKYEPMFNK